jgi:CHAT domain-containing protein
MAYQNTRGDFLHGNLDVALRKADTARRDFSERSPDWAMKFRLLEAEILTYQGRRPDVVALLNSDGVSYPTAGDQAIKRDLLLGFAYARLGQAQQSDQELREARRLSDSTSSPLNGEVLRTEAQIEVYRNDLPEATDLFRKSMQAAHEYGDSFLEAADLLNLGFVALNLEHYDEAVALLKGAADFAAPIRARVVSEAALGNLGVAYFHLGDYDKALSNFQQAEQEAREIGTTSSQVDWLWDAGSSYYKLGNQEEAKRCFEQSLKAALAINEPEAMAGINTQLGLLLYQQGHYDSAKTYSDAAMQAALLSGDKSAELEPRFLQARLAALRIHSPEAERMLMQVDRASAGTPSLQWEIENSIGDFYMATHQLRQAELWYRKSIDIFETQRDAVSDEELKLPFFANGDALYRDYADLLIVSHQPGAALQFLDLGRARTLEEGLNPAKKDSAGKDTAKKEKVASLQNAVNPQAVARRLNATILFYALGPEQSRLWAVTANATRLFTLPGQAEIDARVQRYQKAILRSTDPLRDASEDGRSLYDILVAPAASLIPQNSRVFVIPDGSLNGLNFETLLAPEGPKAGAPSTGAANTGALHYWIEDVTVTNANSIRLLSHLDANSPPSPPDAKNLLLIGNPVLSSPDFEKLPNAQSEVDDIAKHFSADRRTVLTQTDAVPAAYTASHPDRFSYIHFVAHGTASRLSPLDSAVILSASPGQPESFKLYAREIVHHPLHARLVTISACSGSGSRIYAGEGLVGLSWAFLHAGSHNVIAALWEANDASTPRLMDRLYSELDAGTGPDTALRAAKLSLVHSDSVYRKPLYWAAFQLYAGS